MVFSTLGASQPVVRFWPVTAVPGLTGACSTQPVRITLVSEQIEFCAPTSLPFNVVEDNASDPYVSYAGLDQLNDYGFFGIKATNPDRVSGIDRPIYKTGEVVKYRQDVWDVETGKAAQLVSNGPSGVFWGETVPSMEMDLSLVTSSGIIKIRSIEWFVEHGNHLWSFVIRWDTGIQNSREWEAASRNFQIQNPGSQSLADTALDLGAEFREPSAATEVTVQVGPDDVGTPSWWSGVCNDDNFYKDMDVHSFVLGSPLGSAVWHGVAACGPFNKSHPVNFGAGIGEFEFQCVELVMRFLYLEWGIAPFSGNGNTIKNNFPTDKMVFYPNGTHWIVPGDIITEDGTTNGHAMIVTGVTLDGNGTGSIKILEQNSSSMAIRPLDVENWNIHTDSWTGNWIQGWLHAKANQPDGDPDSTFSTGIGTNDRVNAIGLQSDNKIVIAGDFILYKTSTRVRVARLNSSGKLDPNFDPNAEITNLDETPAHVNALKVQAADGYVLVGGYFDHFKTSVRNGIARLTDSGSLDTSFDPGTGIARSDFSQAFVNALAIQPINGFVLAGGDFDRYNGTTVSNLVRLNTSGVLDDTYGAEVNGPVYAIVMQPDGMSLVGGNFSKVNGTHRNGIARIKTDGSLDTDFDPGTGIGGAGTYVASIALQYDGKVLIGGNFSSYNGSARNKIARLNSNGSLDDKFNPGTGLSGVSDLVKTIVPQTDGRILIGGNFPAFIRRLNSDGSQDSSFLARMDGEVNAMLLQPDNKILIGGNFTGHIARLLNHIEPCYTLATQVTPVEGGSITTDLAPNCPGGKYINGTIVKLTAVLNADYWLANWSGAASGTDNPVSVSLNSDSIVIANLMPSPGPFTKIAPADGASGVVSNPILSWGTSLGATSYEYCLYTTNTTYCNSDSHWISTGSSISVTLSNLLPSVLYHWQVRARNAVDTTDGSSWWTFTRNAVPAIPVTVSPNGVNFLIDSQPPFVWNVSAGAASYHLIVHSIDTSIDVFDDVMNSSFCTNGVCSYSLAEELTLGNYEFQVSAGTIPGANSDFSAWRTFRLVVGLKIYLPLVAKPGG